MCICKTKTFDIIKWNVIVKKVTCILKQTKLPNAASISLLFFLFPHLFAFCMCVCVWVCERARIFTCKCRIQRQMASVWNEQHCQKQTTLIELFTRFLFYATSRPPIAPKLCNCYGYVCDDYLARCTAARIFNRTLSVDWMPILSVLFLWGIRR